MTPEERILSFCERLPRDMELSPAHELLILKEIKAAVEEEREACAKIADDYYHSVNPNCYEAAYKTVTAREIRERIRARSESQIEPPEKR